MQRCPAVPTAAKTMPRTARSRSADGATTAALLPPSSSRVRPKRAATTGPTCAPIRVEPVAETRATCGWATRASPTSRPPSTSRETSAGAPVSARARSSRAAQASAVSGRQLRRLPHDGVAADQRDRGVPRPDGDGEVERADDADHAERVPGLHRAGAPAARTAWSGRRPAGSGPTARSQTSIISCTSPSASEVIFPASSVTRDARSALCAVSSSPKRLTVAPRSGAGVERQTRNASARGPDGGVDVVGRGGGDGEQLVAGQRGARRQRRPALVGGGDGGPEPVEHRERLGAQVLASVAGRAVSLRSVRRASVLVMQGP